MKNSLLLMVALSLASTAYADEASSSIAGLPPLSFEVFGIGPPVAVENTVASFYALPRLRG